MYICDVVHPSAVNKHTIQTTINIIVIMAKRTNYKLAQVEYTEAAVRSYLHVSTLIYTSIVDNGENAHDYQNKWSRISENI